MVIVAECDWVPCIFAGNIGVSSRTKNKNLQSLRDRKKSLSPKSKLS